MKINLFFLILHFTFLIFNFSIANAIEVGGHLTEDTTWTPDNNPYLVTEILYVDAGVTLTILPGTEVKVSGASCASEQEYSQNFWLYGGDSIAKMFWVDGKIIAEATEQDSIIFTRMQDDPNFCWGTIYITEQAEMCRFKHCKIGYTAGIGIALGNIAYGAVSIYNGEGIIRKCSFINNGSSIITRISIIDNLEITRNIFYNEISFNNFVANMWCFEFSAGNPLEGNVHTLIAENLFYGSYISINSSYYFSNTNLAATIYLAYNNPSSYFYNNTFTDCQGWGGIHGGHNGDSIYIKKNNFIGGYDGINIDDAYVEISDNYFEGCNLSGPSEYELIGIVKNNIITCTGSAISGRFEEIYNNIFYDCDIVSSVIGSSNIFSNNLIINNLELCNLLADTPIFENNIFIYNDIGNIEIMNNPIFRNCILDFELPPECIDGGGNIWVDSLQVQSLFENIQNGDFHLIEGSLAIDAGFDTLGYYYPFDMDYNHRVWDGDGNGTSIIDIGPYEYGAPAFGGIEGYTYNPTTGEPVDYVLLKINNQPGEFTFSDNLGSFEYKLPAGVYDVYAERVFYEDVIEFDVEVFDEQFTQLLIPMTETVDVENNVIPKSEFLISNLTNFPNPFNPETTISFELNTENTEDTEIVIYNIKGQKVKTFTNLQINKSPNQQIIWNGTDNNNKSVSSGIYFFKISAGKSSAMKKMLLLK